MAKKIRIIGSFICVIILMVAIVLVSIVSYITVPTVNNFKIKETADEYVTLHWTPIERADGYEIFKKADDDKEFKLAGTVKNSEVNEASIVDLSPYKKYEFYIVAYRGDETRYYSEKYKIISTKTLPLRPKLIVESTIKGLLEFKWNDIENANGYELIYTGPKDKQGEIIEDHTITEKTYTDKKVGDEYTGIIRSFVVENGRKIYSPYSDEKTTKITSISKQSNKIDPNRPMIALSFDDGPSYSESSKRILDTLEKYNVKATFFMVGENAKNNPDNLKRKVELGMEIGNHTYNHKHYGMDVKPKDISKSSKAIEKACGVFPTAFRSPGGNTTKVIRDECKAEGMPLYYWSLDTEDWKSRDAKKIYKRVTANVKDGDIILMHEIYDSTADAVEKLVPKLLSMGYQIVTCSDLVEYQSGKEPVAGTQYINGTKINNNTK